MRTLFLLVSLFSMPAVVLAQAATQDVASAVEQVSVFLKGAQVTREAAFDVPSGTSTVTFVGLTPHIDPESIQLDVEGGVVVLSVVHRNNFLDPSEPSAEEQRLQTAKAVKLDSLQTEQAMLEVYHQEAEMLVANQAIGGTATGVPVDELKAAAAFFRDRLTDIKTRQLATERRIASLRKRIAAIDLQLGEIHASRGNRATSEVDVIVTADQRTRGTMALSYITPAAGWYPHYDVRVEDVDSPLTLSYRANVYQTSGEDWNDVRLILSTGDPGQPGTRPQLNPWRIGFYQPRPVGQGYIGDLQSEADGERLDEVVVTGRKSLAQAAPPPAEPVPVEQVVNTTTVEFQIDLPYTIPSDGKPRQVKIEEHSIPALYEYYSAPKLEAAAYLTARIIDWDAYYLLSGEANLFFKNTFVGKSYLDVQGVQDTLSMSLGRDPSIVVEREKVEEFTKRQFLGNRKTETYAFNISVRNGKQKPIRIVIEDQYPLSTDEQIDVDLEASEDAEVNQETGLLRWRLEVPPSAQRQVGFRYSVKYPRSKTVLLN